MSGQDSQSEWSGEPLAEELVPLWRAFCTGYEQGFKDREIAASNHASSRELRHDFEQLLAELREDG